MNLHTPARSVVWLDTDEVRIEVAVTLQDRQQWQQGFRHSGRLNGLLSFGRTSIRFQCQAMSRQITLNGHDPLSVLA
jgi:hypothetical protein